MAAGLPRPDIGRPRLGWRPVLAWLHLWLGLTVGTLFAVVALSGTVLVFHTDLLLATQPQLATQAPVANGTVMGRVLEQWTPRGLTALDLPRTGLPVWQGYLADGGRAYFAPDDGRLLLVRRADDDWLLWLHELHVNLLGGDTGKDALGIAGWIAMGLLVSGAVMWWPRPGKWLRSLTWHRGPPARRWLSWHRSSGAILLPLLGLATLTGVGMVYSAGFRNVLTAALGANPPPVASAAEPAAAEWPPLLAAAQAAARDGRLARVALPAPEQAAITFRYQAHGEWHPVGRSLVSLSRDGKRLLLRYDATADAPGARLSNAIYPLHIGAVGGEPVRWLLALTGLLPAFLLGTGFLFWRRRPGR